MPRRLTPTRIAFLAKATNDRTWVYSAFPDVTGHALNKDDVDALVELDCIHISDQDTGHHGEARKMTLTDADRAALERAK
ncbi:hypothetical protein [Nonomuraea sp. SYSU D8015]|uniref:hypothetical protein n=1 Tax=Nonomuraea sp. SYSU D8015 TaxID=2593644 RepID=UPI0016611CBA|nr:hypothetical protein [Nonomuraea sp. SYSU D8015]